MGVATTRKSPRERKAPIKYEPQCQWKDGRGRPLARSPKPPPALPTPWSHVRNEPENKFYVYEVPGRNGKRKKYQAVHPKTRKRMHSWYYQAAAQAEVARMCTPKEYLALAAQCEWKENVLDISEEDAIAAAANERLELARRPDVPAEYLCVTRRTSLKQRQYIIQNRRWHEMAGAGRAAGYLTAAGAALALARFLGPAGIRSMVARAAPEPEPMTAAEALSAAEAEGLTLLRAESSTGFKYVTFHPKAGARPFKVQRKKPRKSLFTKKGDKNRGCLGNFATAEEAALAVARMLQHS